MRNHLLFTGLVLFGCYIAVSPSLNAQEAPIELQTEAEDFAEEVKQLNEAADTKARQQAIKAVLSKAKTLKKSPSPLVSVIQNRKPKDVFHDLLLLLKADKTARHADFITPLVLAAYDAGEDARLALQAVKSYGQPAVKTLCTMLQSTDSSYQVAAADVAGERINGMAGLAKLVPSLIETLPTADATVQAVAIGSLKKLTLLDLTTSEQWTDWAKDKTALDIITEVGDREAIARTQAEEQLSDVQAKLLAVTLERMRSRDRENAPALLKHLDNSEYLIVRIEAVKLLSGLLTKLDDAKSKPVIEALGQALNDPKNPDKLRLASAEGLAEAHKSALSFKYVDEYLEKNGISVELKLALLKALNSPIAAPRLVKILTEEIDNVSEHSGQILLEAIKQLPPVIAFQDKSTAKDDALAQLSRLLGFIALEVVREDIAAPARERFVDLAVKTNEALVHLARIRQVDISVSVEPLLKLAHMKNGVASSALTALQEGLGVPSAAVEMKKELTTPPVSDELAALYQVLMAQDEETLQIKLLGLYEILGSTPEPVEMLQARLLEFAKSAEADLPSNPESRQSQRDALRGLLSSVLDAKALQALMTALLAAPYGQNDFIGLVRILPKPRIDSVQPALEPMVNADPIRLALLLHKLMPEFEPTERELISSLTTAASAGAKKTIRGALDAAIKAVPDDAGKAKLGEYAEGPLASVFITESLAALLKAPEKTDGRGYVAMSMLSALKAAHPEKYDAVKLDGLEKEAFSKAISDLSIKMKTDGYAVP
ncbi:MAG: hypothetical protein L3J82_00305 [Planctomycetes bacterium]|nr:hypothetical protein [Planctomycetota bacterium]